MRYELFSVYSTNCEDYKIYQIRVFFANLIYLIYGNGYARYNYNSYEIGNERCVREHGGELWGSISKSNSLLKRNRSAPYFSCN